MHFFLSLSLSLALTLVQSIISISVTHIIIPTIKGVNTGKKRMRDEKKQNASN